MPGRFVHLPEGNGVHQGECRHVQDHVREHAGIEGGELPGTVERIHENAASDVQRAEQPLRVHITVGDEPHDERCDDRAPGLGGVCERTLCAARVQVRGEIAAERDEPAAPDEELEKHH